MSLELTADERETVRAILARHLPRGVRVYAFGSRASGRPKPTSDLDLALDGAAPITIAEMAELREAFDESPLPWKVDLIDMASVSAAFSAIIARDRLPLFES
jgi:uncharacterized protein